MKYSFSIREGSAPALLEALAEQFGGPRSFEELVVYSRDQSGVRAIITRDAMKVSWGLLERPSDVGKRRKKFTMSTDNLKDKLDFIFGNNQYCDIGVCSVLEFHDPETNAAIGYRPDTFVGPILSFEIADHYQAMDGVLESLDQYHDAFRPYLNDNLTERIDAISRKSERCFIRTSERLALNPRILEFCRSNGIVNPLGRPFSYRELQASKSNDYSRLEDLFTLVAGNELLSEEATDPSAPIPESVSIIIPCFNTEATIERVIRGIEGQAGLDRIVGGLQIVLIDDGSAQPIKRALDALQTELNVNVVRLETNSGVSHARQMGMAHSTGDILMFIDSDIILSTSYVYDHAIRNSVLGDSLFVSFKRNVGADFARDVTGPIRLDSPDYSGDLRVGREVSRDTAGIYKAGGDYEVNILEESNFFKDFHGSRVFGVFDLASMIIGHNFTGRRSTFEKAEPFSRAFRGWGMEDVYLGLRAIASGTFLIPVLSAGVYHIDHDLRSGSDEAKQAEFAQNRRMIEQLLTQPATRKFTGRGKNQPGSV